MNDQLITQLKFKTSYITELTKVIYDSHRLDNSTNLLVEEKFDNL